MSPYLADQVHDARALDRPQRTGASRVEQRAVACVREHVAAMPASLVVQLAMWPDELARWARAERIAESVVYNLLAARKPYLRMRERLAAQLGVQTGHLAALVDAAPAGSPAPGPAARARAGDNPLERRAVEVVALEVAAMPAATVVGLAMWPETLTQWARARGVQPSAVWATLAGAPSEVIATALARRLDVSVREVLTLVEAERRPAGERRPGTAVPADTAPPPGAVPTAATPATPAAAASARPTPQSGAPSTRPGAPDQLSLGF